MSNIEKYSERIFEDIKHFTEDGVEFWFARELQTVLEYTKWDNFKKVIEKAKISCKNSNINVSDHFADVGNMVQLGSGAQREIEDVMLSRYACYLLRKKLKKNQKILDHMGSTELAANLFRATQTDEKLRREKIRGKEKANQIHYEVGAKVRQTIKELGGTMPEDLPTPEKSIKEIEKEQKRKELATD